MFAESEKEFAAYLTSFGYRFRYRLRRVLLSLPQWLIEVARASCKVSFRQTCVT